jgi:hypothetical protein
MSEPKAKQILGIGGLHTHDGGIRADEFLQELKGRRAIKKFREMRDNDSIVGAVMYAIEQVLRDVPYKVVPADESDQAKAEAEFVKQVLEDMDHSFDDHISEALSSLSFGFSTFEVVYKRRVGPRQKDPKKKSKFTDGRLGVRKIASRAQWTINRFEVDKRTGDILGVYQDQGFSVTKNNFIPSWKLLHYRTITTNNDPSGRSILRNAYKSYTFLNNLQSIEAIAVERELHGIPVGRMPAEYLATNATDEQKALKSQFERILRDLKNNEQGFALLPSDLYVNTNGEPTDQRLMDIELITSNGSRNIEIHPIIQRYQHDIARSMMAEFLMLGSEERGSYALSKSKTDLFQKSLESYINSIYDVVNKQLIERLWELNGLDLAVMPKLVPGDVSKHELKELGAYLRNLNGADISLADQVEIVDELLNSAELPPLDREVYEESRERARAMDQARADYYDDDKTPGSQYNTAVTGNEDDSQTKPKGNKEEDDD